MRISSTAAGIREDGRRRVLPGGAILDVRAGTAWVEGSTPKALRGVNYPGASIEEAQAVAADWLREADGFVRFMEAPRVNRLDVVRDFDLGGGLQAAEVVAAVGRVPVTLAATKALYRGPSDRQGQTAMVRTKRAGGGRLYDKGAESGLAEAAGVVRFEAQERTRTLRSAGVVRLADVRADRAESLARRRFAWCGFDAGFSALDVLLRRVMGDDSITEGQRLQLVAFYSLASAGVGLSLERRRHYRLRKLAATHGYPAEVGFRLDLDAGLVAA